MSKARPGGQSAAVAIAAEASLPFRDWVVARQRQAGEQRKGERTRARIRLATVDLLNDLGYRNLKVSDVCRRARITPPVLYLYFDSKESLVEDVLREFLEQFVSRAESEHAATPYQAMYAANLRWLRSARANAGLLRCLLQFSDETPAFARLFARSSHQWYLRIAQSIVRRFPQAAPEERQLQLIVHALGGMMDDLSRRLYTEQDPDLAMLVAAETPTDESLATLLSALWYRALYGADPADAGVGVAAPRLAASARGSARRPPRRVLRSRD